MKNGDEVKAKIMEVGPDVIRYKKESYLDGPDYVVKKSQISQIRYGNGETEDYGKVVEDVKEKKQQETPEYGKNIISVNPLNVVFSTGTISYERIISQGKMGIKVPIEYGWAARYAAAGCHLNFYPFGQQRWSYYLGPALYGGLIDYTKISGWTTRTVQVTILGAYFNNGVSFMATKGFYMGANAGIGATGLINAEPKPLVGVGYIVGLHFGGRF